MTYEPYTVYSEPALDLKDYKSTVIVVFHGFLSAMPNGFFKTMNQAFGQTHTVIGYNYDYFDIAKTIKHFDWFYQQALAGKMIYFAGTSLGGFWAQYLGHQYSVQKLILSNPTIEPETVLTYFLDKENYSERRKEHVKVTMKKLNQYKTICLEKQFSGQRLILLTQGDDIQDFSIARNFFKETPDTSVTIFPDGGHSIDFKTHTSALSTLEAFIR